MKKTFMMVVLGAALTASSSFGGGIVTTYTDLGSWIAAVGTPTFTDTFDTSTQPFTTFTLVGTRPDSSLGPTSQFFGVGTNVAAGTGTPSHAFINNGVFQDVVDTSANGCGCALTTSYAYSGGTPIYGIAGNFSSLSAGAGQGLVAVIKYADNSTVSVNIANGFDGFVSTTAFTSLMISGGTGSGTQETYTVDNLAFAPAPFGGEVIPPPSGVPEPTTFSMLGVALVGLGAIARKRRS